METHEEKKEEAIQRSEEVQTIIDRMPTRGATYAIGLTSLLVTIIHLIRIYYKVSGHCRWTDFHHSSFSTN